MWQTCNTGGMTATTRRLPRQRGAAFADLITQARRTRGWSQDALADIAGVSRSTIIRWEAGDASRPDPIPFADVCYALGIDQERALRSLGFYGEPSPATKARCAA